MNIADNYFSSNEFIVKQKKEENCFVCWHPEPSFSYQHTKVEFDIECSIKSYINYLVFNKYYL